jgi:N-acetyl-anhydromuramyl-L-alanine amidase AmpD
MSEYQIIWKGCAASNREIGRKGQKARAIVQHIMTGTLPGTDKWFNTPRPAAPSSAHFGIGATGEIHQYVAVEDTAYSNGILVQPNLAAVPWLADAPWPGKITANHFTVSIEWAGNHVWKGGEIGGEVLEWWQPTEPQYQAGLWLTNKLVTEQRIGIDRASITRHSDYNSSMKPGGKGWCPGLGFPMPRLLDDLKALSAPPAPPDFDTVGTVFGPPTGTLAMFTALLLGSPALEDADAIDYWQASIDAGVNPFFMLAIFNHESHMGRDQGSTIMREKTKNPGALRPHAGEPSLSDGISPSYFRKYSSWLDGWKDMAGHLHRYYAGKKPSEVFPIWAPASDNNSPTGYIAAVLRDLQRWAGPGN